VKAEAEAESNQERENRLQAKEKYLQLKTNMTSMWLSAIAN